MRHRTDLLNHLPAIQWDLLPAPLSMSVHTLPLRRVQCMEMRKKAAKYGIQVECWYLLVGTQSQGLLLRDSVIKNDS